MRKEGKIKPVTLMENVFAKMAIMGKNVNQVCVNESFIQNLIFVKLFFFVTFTTSLISECNCFKKGSTCIRCDENGKCKCKKPYYTGDKCDKCIDGRYKPEENCLGKI